MLRNNNQASKPLNFPKEDHVAFSLLHVFSACPRALILRRKPISSKISNMVAYMMKARSTSICKYIEIMDKFLSISFVQS